MTNEEQVKLTEILEKLQKLIVEVELLVCPVRNIYEEQDKVLPYNYA
jgi:hypothetical protein